MFLILQVRDFELYTFEKISMTLPILKDLFSFNTIINTYLICR